MILMMMKSGLDLIRSKGSFWQDPLQTLWLSQNESVGLGINPLIRKRNDSISGNSFKEQHNE